MLYSLKINVILLRSLYNLIHFITLLAGIVSVKAKWMMLSIDTIKVHIKGMLPRAKCLFKMTRIYLLLIAIIN